MKHTKVIFGLAFFFMASHIYGQVAKWLIPPSYDEIRMADGADLIITDSLGIRIMWTQQGKRLSSTKDDISSFVEGYAVTTREKNTVISGFYNHDGNFTPLPKLFVTYSMPCFSDGKLLVYDGTYYRFVNVNGKFCNGIYVSAFPYTNGYASCETYENFQKEKDRYSLLISEDNEEVNFSYNGKGFDNNDIEFISSVNDENIGIVVAKHKLYFFNGKDKSLSPVFGSKREKNIKNQAKLEKDIQQSLSIESDTVHVLYAKCGKTDQIQIRFNKLRIPLSISYTDGEYVYKKKQKEVVQKKSPLRIVSEEKGCGINWEEMEVLPPQFDDVIACFDNTALVRIGGKCGMLKVDKDLGFNVIVNDGEKIGFKHKKFKTKIRLDMPSVISTENAWIEVDAKSGCEVDLPSGEKKETSFGNNIRYDCALSIPDSLPDEMYDDFRNEITYPTQVCYDGLKSPIIPYKVMAWHNKYYNVDEIESERSIMDGVLSFTFNINAERNSGDEYPLKPMIQLDDSLDYDLDKISETRYKCKVFNLKDGNNNIVIQILEEGCPPVSFPFEVTYTKPVAKTHNKPGVKESVEITKKTKKSRNSSNTITPILEI